ncbi:hypothetical protein [Streptomyces cucumeris]|uniref:hypothetical protein n=1 Tax=Streptomyces cucumeris TaxID=2962890 RepID=UPI0020C8EEF5|nr:hypothetical protein [Streptomyces sp. NEAU-Y11]MCP9205488.1 hypothetical protein [Streptomyces sp. NEAU-Y11]
MFAQQEGATTVAELFGINPTQGGAVVLITIVVLMVLTGRLVPRSTLQDMREERDTWRAAHSESEAGRAADREQIRELLELSRTAGHVLTSLPQPQREEVAADARLDQAPTSSG